MSIFKPKQTAIWPTHLLVISSYLVLALIFTWPTVSQFATHLPGDGGDDPATAWNLWWVKYSLLNAPQNPLHSELMFYPLGVNLAYYTLAALNGVTTIPILLNFGTVAASNWHMWLSLLLSGYGTFLLIRWVLAEAEWASQQGQGKLAAAWLGGLMYAFASHKLFYLSLGQFTIASTHWLPFSLLFFLKMYHQPRNLRWASLTALFLVLQTWSEMIYASFLIIFMAFAWVFWLMSDSQRRVIRWPFLRATALLIGLFAAGIAPLLAALLGDMRREGDFFVEGTGFAEIFSADVFGFFVPTVLHPWLGELVTKTNILRLDPNNPAVQQIYKSQHIYLGYVLVGLVLWGGWHYRGRVGMWFWAAVSLLFGLLLLGPTPIINGVSVGVPGPFVILQQLPFFNGNRYPSRFSVMVGLTLIPLASLGVLALFERRPRLNHVATVGLLAALFLFEHAAIPLPQSDMRVPPIYQEIAANPSDPQPGALLDIPFAWRNGFRITGAFTTQFMFGQFYQTTHQRPLLQGNTSRNPEFLFQYFTQAPVLSSLRILQTGHTLPSEQWATDRELAPAVLRFFNIDYLVVRPEPPGYLNHPQATQPYIEQVLPVQRVFSDSRLSLYETNLPPWPSDINLLENESLRPLYFGAGWSQPQTGQQLISAQRERVRLLVPFNGQSQTFRATVRTPAPLGEFSSLRVRLNGWQSEAVRLSGQWQDMAVTLPASAIKTGLNDVYLEFERTYPVPNALTESGDWPEITLVSAGEEAGNIGHIYLNGMDISPGARGYNVAVIDRFGNVRAVSAFDTHLDPTANQALSDFIARAPSDTVVAVVAKDEASSALDDVGVAALRSLGAQVDLRGQFRASHALLGQTSGIAVGESTAQHLPATLSTGLGLTEASVAAQFQSLRFTAEGE